MKTNGCKQGAHTLDGRVKVVENIGTNRCGQFGPKAGEHFVFVHDQHFANAPYGGIQGIPVQGNERTQVNDLYRSVQFLCNALCCFKTQMGGVAIGNQGQIFPCPTDAGFAKRDLKIVGYKGGGFCRIVQGFGLHKQGKPPGSQAGSQQACGIVGK